MFLKLLRFNADFVENSKIVNNFDISNSFIVNCEFELQVIKCLITLIEIPCISLLIIILFIYVSMFFFTIIIININTEDNK